MSSSKAPEGDQPRKEINGPRPSPLKINKHSLSIHKSTSSSSTSSAPPQKHRHQPVIIYMHSPKIIHTQARDFMALVQKLTGLSRSRGIDHDEEVNYKNSERNGNALSSSGENCEKSTCFNAGNPCFADIPLFTPTPTQSNFFCSTRPLHVYSDSPKMEKGIANPISPSVFEFLKELPEY
ncbi:VQ protein [Dillenia turbinata]|uniref:VQ protein n=1 Tax=Dillenia turbinata TaxID=194707 RepID=A0AAN8Z0B6_9MAGN